MSPRNFDFVLTIGGEAGQGIATPGDILARIFIRRGLHLSTYNAYQSLIRGGHIFLFMRMSDQKVYSHGDKIDMMLCLNQDTMDRHFERMGPGSTVIYNADSIEPASQPDGVQMIGLPIADLTQSRNKLIPAATRNLLPRAGRWVPIEHPQVAIAPAQGSRPVIAPPTSSGRLPGAAVGDFPSRAAHQPGHGRSRANPGRRISHRGAGVGGTQPEPRNGDPF